MEVLLQMNLDEVKQKEQLFRTQLQHPLIRKIHSHGLWMAVEFENFEQCKQIIDRCIERGVFTDWFLFASHCMRISPPLTISEGEIRNACTIILEAIEA
jgi:acetylornithine/N-succinyldiaminopimelate aminotransferase